MAVNRMQLYLKEKYPVFIGESTNLGLCTCWADPNTLLAKDPSITKTFAIIGTLYSREGVSILLRNLCLNPSINTIIIWGNSPLSKTAIGSAGRNLLLDIFSKGIDLENHVIGSTDSVHAELQREILQKVFEKVKVIDLSSLTQDVMIEEAKKYRQKTITSYMQSINFPEPKREALGALPSEKVGFAVRGKTLTGAWVKVVDRIIRYGSIRKTENASNQKELQSVTWTIESDDPTKLYMPDWPENLKNQIGLEKRILEQYKTIFTDPLKKAGSAYTYGNRLNDYMGMTDQIEEIIKKLKKNIETRQVFASTFYPPEDLKNPSPPCLTNIQILATTDHVLNMFATFRSHDIFKAAVPNAFGLLHLHKHIASKVGQPKGSLTITSVSAHIYEEDWKMALNTVKCAVWESTKLYFDENEDVDPRGIVRISLRNQSIFAEIVSLSGDELYTYVGKTAREVGMKIARLEMLSMSTHYVDITIELVKAEMALKNNLPYIQDRPFVLKNGFIK